MATPKKVPQAYCMKTKQKEDFKGAVEIMKTERGQYIAKGVSKDKHKLALILSESDAKALVKAKLCKKGW